MPLMPLNEYNRTGRVAISCQDENIQTCVTHQSDSGEAGLVRLSLPSVCCQLHWAPDLDLGPNHDLVSGDVTSEQGTSDHLSCRRHCAVRGHNCGEECSGSMVVFKYSGEQTLLRLCCGGNNNSYNTMLSSACHSTSLV